MGTKSKLKASRRAIRREDSDRLRALDVEARSRPELAALLAERETDAELTDVTESMRPAQEARLQAAGFRCRIPGADRAGMWDSHRLRLRIIHGTARESDGRIWGHVSVSSADGTLPGWYYVRDAQRLLYPDHAGIVVIAPEASHVNLAEVAHVWTCLTADLLPDFGRFGTI